jgi:hypothetical protein
VQVTDGAVDEGGDVSFAVPDSRYPRTYASTFRTIKDDGGRAARRQEPHLPHLLVPPVGLRRLGGLAVVTVTRAGGAVEQVPATLVDGRWTADTNLAEGDAAVVAPGAVRDALRARRTGQA